MGYTFDIEARGFLDDSTVDYSASPYKLREESYTHCVVFENHETGAIVAFYNGDKYELDGREYAEVDGNYTYELKGYEPLKHTHYQLSELEGWVTENMDGIVVAHNGIAYDLLALKLEFGMDYTIEDDTWCGNRVQHEDTLVTSKALNPDMLGGHSLEVLGGKVGMDKIQFRKNIPESYRFKVFAADMLYYCVVDVKVNTKLYFWLEKQKGTWDWAEAIKLEKQVAEVVARQSHRGFNFNSELANACIPDLDNKLAAAKKEITPVLPDRVPTKGYQKEVTPPATQLKKDGSLGAHLRKFVIRHGGSLVQKANTGIDKDDYDIHIFDKTYSLPLPAEPLVDTIKCTLSDITEIKEWLVSLGWVPSEWNEKDITMYSDKRKGKMPRDKFEITVERYVEQTLNSPLRDERCDHLHVAPHALKAKLLKIKGNRGQKVLTNPKFTRGQEKEICPNLERLADKFPYAREIVDYLTYKHRRNSILGGGLELGEEAEKGYLASVRSDGRIPTPADTCGAATSRFTHRVVANIPRVTSLYGHEMRGLFGVDDGFYQLGYDFDSLEAKIEADGVYRYEGGKEYGYSLTAEKPNDCHSVLARRLTEILGTPFPRGSAKPVKYGCSYGAQAPRVAKTIGCDLKTGEVVFNVFWEQAKPLLLLKDKMLSYWETAGKKTFLLGLDGRKLPVRSKGNLVNTRFQSSGVICAKKAMVLHDQYMREEGLTVDFFKDDWKSAKFCQQMIAYHDEAQLEISKELVKFRMASSEEEMIKIKEEVQANGSVWSDISKSDKGWYIAWCRAGELAAKAVKDSGDYYGLNVELTAGYIIGRSWAECH